MTNLLFRLERRARFLMGGVACLTLLALVLFNSHLIESQPSYDAYGWYTVNPMRQGMLIARRMDSESACRESAVAQAINYMQGKSLNAALVGSSKAH
jgi:hypothetical protein